MSEPNSVYPKMAKVMAGVEHIPKRGRNEFHKYDYALAADVLDSVRKLFVEHGLVLLPSCESIEREVFGEKNLLTGVQMTFTIADPKTGDAVTMPWFGDGMDKGDKGIWKAYTGAEKYFLMQTFLIPTGDDPEGDKKVDEAVKDGPGKREKREASPADDEDRDAIDTRHRKELGKLLMLMSDDDKEEAKVMLRDLTTFTDKSGEEVVGLKTLALIKGQRLDIAVSRARKAYAVMFPEDENQDDDLPY